MVHELQFEINPSQHNKEKLFEVQADLIIFPHKEEEF